MPEEQNRCRAVSPSVVLTAGLMRPYVNYNIVRVGCSQMMDCKLQYHTRGTTR